MKKKKINLHQVNAVVMQKCKHQWETEPVDRRRCFECGRIEKNYFDVEEINDERML